MITLPGTFNRPEYGSFTTSKTKTKQFFSTKTPHSPIIITCDGNFSDYGFPGNGSAVNPFIIENYNITTNDEIGISILDTTKFFIIRNCYIDAYRRGIDIENTAIGTASIINNICINHWINYCRIYYFDYRW